MLLSLKFLFFIFYKIFLLKLSQKQVFNNQIIEKIAQQSWKSTTVILKNLIVKKNQKILKLN